ncbi:MAG: DinB family protein [Ferruginibacter sp.]|nr:DinB family protein [Ferruginibacter sp.]
MKKILLTYAAYNVWANQRMVDCVTNLSDEQIHKQINSSFGSVYAMLGHLWDVESIWWQRVKLNELVEWPGVKFSGSVLELCNHLMHQSKQWKEWIDIATETVLEHEFIYKNSKKEQFKQPVSEALHHLFNHQTFHRGQLITMLKQVGVTELPNTDLIAFYRKK